MDMVLLDVDLKDNIPVSVKISLLRSAGVTAVLMSTYSEPHIIREALAAGALGYLVKTEDADMIVDALHAAAEGEVFISAELDLAVNGRQATSPPPASPRRSAGSWRSTRRASGQVGRLSAADLRGDGEELPQADPGEVPRLRTRRRDEGRAADAGDPGRHPRRRRRVIAGRPVDGDGNAATIALGKAGIAFVPHEYRHDPGATGYGLEAAAAIGADPDRVLKTLLAEVEGVGLVVGVVPVSGTLDLKALAQAADGKRAVMARPEVAERRTGYVVGGISPIGQKSPLRPSSMRRRSSGRRSS